MALTVVLALNYSTGEGTLESQLAHCVHSSQLSRIARETHAFHTNVTHTRIGLHFSRILAKF